MYSKEASKYMNKGIILSILSIHILYFVQSSWIFSLILAAGYIYLVYGTLTSESEENELILFPFLCITICFLFVFFRWYTLPVELIGIYGIYRIHQRLDQRKKERHPEL